MLPCGRWSLPAGAFAHVVRENPRWIDQGQSLRELAISAAAYLRGCHLRGVAGSLEREVRR